MIKLHYCMWVLMALGSFSAGFVAEGNAKVLAEFIVAQPIAVLAQMSVQ